MTMRTSMTAFVLSTMLAAAGCSGGSGSTPDPGIELSIASAKASYAAGERIDLTITLTNDGQAAGGLSSMIEGNLTVVSMTRDGAGVTPETRTILIDEELGAALALSLASVAPGDAVTGPWQSGADGNGGRALRTVVLDASGPSARLYSVSQPGAYELRVRYRYAGATPASGAAPLAGESNEAVVSFTIAP
jgi:hypothetical protein